MKNRIHFSITANVIAVVLMFCISSQSIFAQTMTFDTGPTHPGFTLAGWSWKTPSPNLFPTAPNVNNFTQITKDAGTWTAVSFQTWPFGGGGGTWEVTSDLGNSFTFNPNALPAGHTTTLNWANISWLKIKLIAVGTGGTNQSFDFDNVAFTTAGSPPVVLTCPINTTAAACQSQAAINTAFSTWLATANGSGGCNGVLTNNNTGAPSACGGSTTVTFTYTSTCAPFTTTCQATFTVTASPPVILTCPTNTTVAACQSQAAINTAFSTWLATISASGGCNGALTNNNTGAPAACGGSTTVTFTYTSTCAPLTTTCQATFTVPAAPTVVLTCPSNTTVAACQTQAAVNTAFATWLATASASGGCNGALTNNNTGAPAACGGSTTVTFTYTSTCSPLTVTCQATFTVPAAPTVVLTCPINTTAAACQSQAAINTAFSTWLATASASGGCNGVLTNNNTGAPSACGGSTTVTFTYNSTCAPLTTTCQASFTVPASPPVVLTCPINTTAAACQSQAAINMAFSTWLATASASGGCNGVLTNNNTGAPSACGGSTTVTFTYTSTCAPLTTTCQATFTVTAAPPVILSCPTNTTAAACQSQAAINTAFSTWLATASAFGGCNGVLTNNNTGAPSACGGSTTVTFTYTNNCAPLTTTCQATFTVTASPPVVLTCPINTTAAACQSQAAINTAFSTWLATASASGGCNGVLTNNNTGAPSACGGSTTVTFTYTNNCAPFTTTCQATFTVAASPVVVLTCPANTTAAACQSQAAINTAFSTWLATASASGGCNGVLTNNNSGAPAACGGSTTVTFTYTNNCAPLTTTCQATFTVAASPVVVLTCPVNTTAAACQSQAAINTAFSTWLATASASGGCNGVLTNNNSGAPAACGGSTTVTFTYTNNCAPFTTTCQATFTVTAAPTVVLSCPSNTTVATCQTQAAVNTAFATWLATASASGGCNGALTNNNTGAPAACGGSTTVTFTYASTCAPLTTTCQATFTVPASPTVVLTCPANTTAAACQSQAAINTAFSTWLATASGSGGCNGTLTNNNTGAPSACGGNTTVTFTRTSTCAPFTTTCQATFTVASILPVISCPGTVTVSCAALVPPVNTGSVTITAGCANATVTHVGDVISNQTCPNKFTLTRTYRISDLCGNSSTCNQVIIVNDITPPALVGVPANITINCNQTVPSAPAVTGTDNCSGNVNVTMKETSTKSNFPNQCSAYTYKITRTWTGIDLCGNSTSRSQVIQVRDNQAPVWKSTPPAFITVQCDEDDVNNVDPVAMDGCDGNPSVLLKIEYLPIPKSCVNNYRVRSTWTAGDKCGNIIKFVQIITVLDTEAPIIVCPKDIDLISLVPVPVSWVAPKAIDFCDGNIIPVQIAGPPSGSTFQPGTKTLITYKATDGCGNMKTCSFTVNIKSSPSKIGFDDNSAVDNEDLQEAPDGAITENGITLYQNEPNPFSSNTFIRFDLDKTQNAMLCIFDVNGRMVKCYENTYNKGENKVELTQADLPAAGVYFYQLKTAEHNSTKRMIMIR